MEIDSRLQQGQLASLDSVRAQREIDVTYARQEAERAARAAEGGRREPDGCRPRCKRIERRRSTAQDDRGTDPHGAHRPRVLPCNGADGRDRRRHPGSRRRSCDEGNEIDLGRCERGTRGLSSTFRSSRLPRLTPGIAGANRRRQRRHDRRREDRLRLAVRRHTDADRAGKNAGLGSGNIAHRSIRPVVRRSGRPNPVWWFR